jgi:hypothetical protein
MNDLYFISSAFLLAFGTLVSSLEIIAFRSLYSQGGLMAWETGRLRSVILLRSGMLHSILSENRLRHFTTFRIVASIFLLVCVLTPLPSLIMVACILMLLSCALFSIRTPYGLDGSDQAFFLISAVLTIYSIVDSPLIRNSVHLFLGVQLTLVYFTSGWCKLKARNWRNGTYLWKLFSTSYYGMQALGKFLENHKRFSHFASLVLVLFETLFFLFWLLPAPYCWLLLSALGIFHVATAITMGLNTFLWAFLAMYPSTVWCRLALKDWIGS